MSKKAPGFVLQKRATFWFIKIPMAGSSMDLVIFQQDFDFRVQPLVLHRRQRYQVGIQTARRDGCSGGGYLGRS